MPTIRSIADSLSEYVQTVRFVDEQARIDQVCLPGEHCGAADHTLFFGRADEFRAEADYRNIVCIDHNSRIADCQGFGAVNVIVLSKLSNYQKVFNEIAALVHRHQEQMHSSILGILNAEDINTIVHHISELFGAPAALLDARYEVRSHWPGGAWFREHRYFFHKELESGGFSSMDNGTLYAQVNIDRTPSLLIQLSKSERLVGHLLLVGVRACDLHRLEPVAVFLANKLTAADNVFRAENYSFETFIIDILNGIRHNPAKIDEVLSLANWDSTDSYYFIKVESRATGTSPNSLQQFTAELSKALPLRSAVCMDAVYAIINRSRSGFFYREDFSKKFAQLMARHQVRVGFSDIFTHFHYIYDCARQPDIAIQYGALFNPTHLTHPYDFYAQYELINIMSTHMDMEQYVHPIVRLLHDYDNKNGTAYITTLYAYLNEDRKIQATANFLGIHKNSMLKRLEKMRQITAMDPNLLFRTTHMRLSCSIVKHLALMENGTVPSLPELPMGR